MPDESADRIELIADKIQGHGDDTAAIVQPRTLDLESELADMIQQRDYYAAKVNGTPEPIPSANTALKQLVEAAPAVPDHRKLLAWRDRWCYSLPERAIAQFDDIVDDLPPEAPCG